MNIKEAIANTTHNLVIEASAGTGKTTVIIAKILYLLLAEKINIKEIVAITFTEKAAQELKERLYKALISIKEGKFNELVESCYLPQEIANTETAFIDNILLQIDSAPLGTIHHFTSLILHKFPIEADVPAQFEIDATGEAFKSIFNDVWNKFQKLITTPMGSPEFKARSLELGINTNDLKQVLSAFELKTLKVLAEEISKNPRIELNNHQNTLLLNLSEHSFLKTHTIQQEETQTFQEWQDIFKKAIDLLIPIAQKVRETFYNQGKLSFDDLLVKTLKLLTEKPMWILQELQNTYKIYIVDEFQDTDPIQSYIILLLSANLNKEPNRLDMNSIKLNSGKLFFVGDPKQSIYSFRGANLSTYQQIKKIIKNNSDFADVDVSLQITYRHHPKLLKEINSIFKEIYKDEELTYYDVKCPQSTPNPDFATENNINPSIPRFSIILAQVEKNGDEDEPEDIKCIKLVKFIQNNIKIFDKKSNKHRSAQFKDIAILFRKFTDMSHFLQSFSEAGIPYTIGGGSLFYTRQEVIDFIQLIRYIAYPTDTLSLLAVLRSPLCCVNDKDIFENWHEFLKLTQISRTTSIKTNLPKEKQSSLNYLFNDVLAELIQLKNVEGLYEFITEILKKTNFIEIYSTFSERERIIPNILKILQLAEEQANLGKNFYEFVEYLSNKAETESGEEEAVMFEEYDNAIRILTIHKAKGLEFPIVIIPQIHSYSGKDNEISVNILEHEKLFPTTKENRTSQIQFNNIDIFKLQAENKKAIYRIMPVTTDKRNSLIEIKNLLYVAITRAKEYVFLTGTSPKKKNSESFWAILSNNFKDINNYVNQSSLSTFFEEQTNLEETSHKSVNIALTKLNKLWDKRREKYQTICNEKLILLPSKINEKMIEKLASKDTEWTKEEKRDIGSACHDILHHWDFIKEPYLPEKIINLFCTKHNLKDKARKRVITLLQNFLNSEILQELKNSEIVAKEVPIFYQSEKGYIVDGKIDILYKKEIFVSGSVETLFIVGDYKTEEISNNNINNIIEAYTPQLLAYLEGVKKVYSKNQKQRADLKVNYSAKLFLLDTGKIIEIC